MSMPARRIILCIALLLCAGVGLTSAQGGKIVDRCCQFSACPTCVVECGYFSPFTSPAGSTCFKNGVCEGGTGGGGVCVEGPTGGVLQYPAICYAEDINEDPNVFVDSSTCPVTVVPVASDWGYIALIGILGGAGVILVLRRGLGGPAAA